MNSTLSYISCIGVVQNGRVVRFLRTLAAAGYDVSAIRPGQLIDPEDINVIAHYALPEISASFWYDAGLLNTLMAMGQRARNSILLGWKLLRLRPDIIICSELDSWMIAVLAKLTLDSIVIADLREVYDDRALVFPNWAQGSMRRLLRGLMRILSKQTDEIIHVSLERQEAYSYLDKPGIILGSYPDLRQFPLHDERTAARGSESVIAIHVGALRPTYASEQLLDAMSLVADAMPQVRFVVLGGVSGKLVNDDLVNMLMSRGVLEFHEQVPSSEVVRKLAESDIGINLVLPVDTAHRLAAPQKLYEYFAAGLPVVVADAPTLRRIVMERDCGVVVDASSPQSIADGIITLAHNAEMRRSLGENARIAAEDTYNWESQMHRLCDMMDNLLVRLARTNFGVH